MYTDQYEEHLAHSAPCSSRWDGFDRGDAGEQEPIDTSGDWEDIELEF